MRRFLSDQADLDPDRLTSLERRTKVSQVKSVKGRIMDKLISNESAPNRSPGSLKSNGVVGIVTAALLIAGLAVSLGTPTVAAAGDIELTIPRATGNYQVGTRAELAVDRSREMGFGMPGKRKLMIQLFYPRAKTRVNGKRPRCLPSDYAPRAIVDHLAEKTSLTDRVNFKTGACKGGPSARGKHPTVILSHAFAANRMLYTSLATDLASRGFIVAVVDHTYEAFMVKFPTGPIAEGIYGGPLDATEVAPAELAELESVRSDDVSFALTYVNRLSSRKASPLFGHVDKGRSGIFGHSLGGGTSFEAANDDGRFDASANLDGEVWNDSLAASNTTKPHLLLLSEGALLGTFQFTLACAYYERLTGPKHALLLTDAMHYAFSDFQVMAPQILEQNPEWQLASLLPDFIGTAGPRSAVAIQRETLAKFFRFYLGPRKDGSPKLESGSKLTSFSPSICYRTVPTAG